AGAWLAMGELPVVDSTAAAGGWPTGRNGVRLTSVRIGAGAMPVKKGSREEGPDTAGDGRHEWRGSASRDPRGRDRRRRRGRLVWTDAGGPGRRRLAARARGRRSAAAAARSARRPAHRGPAPCLARPGQG